MIDFQRIVILPGFREPHAKTSKTGPPKLLVKLYFTFLAKREEKIDAGGNLCDKVKAGHFSSAGNYIAYNRSDHKAECPAVEEFLIVKAMPVFIVNHYQPDIGDAFQQNDRFRQNELFRSLFVPETFE